MRPQISFIIPAFNRPRFLLKTLDSIFKQKKSSFEIIVVDDNSHINLQKFFKKKYPQIKFLRQNKNMGASAARNRGYKSSRGKYICYLDSDDLLEPDFSWKMIEVAKKNKQAVLCLSKARFMGDWSDSHSNKIVLQIINSLRNLILRYFYIFNNQELPKTVFFATSTSRLLFPRELAQKYHFKPDWRQAEEWELVLRLLNKKDKIYLLPEKLITFSFSSNSQTNQSRRLRGLTAYYDCLKLLNEKEKQSLFIRGFKIYTKFLERINAQN